MIQRRSKRYQNRTFSSEQLEARSLLSNFVVSPSGSDSNVGDLAHPFATIQHAASVAQPGDTVYIRGGTYHETVTPARSGISGAPIIFEPYDGASVTVSGADPVGGWTAGANSVYSTSPGWNLGDNNNQVFLD